MTLWKFTAREIRNRPGRATLTLLSVVIGVGAVVSVRIATTTTHRAYKEMYEAMTGRAALEVVAGGGGSFDEKVLSEIETVPGLAAAVPGLQRPSILYLGESPQGAEEDEEREGEGQEAPEEGQPQRRIKLLLLGIDPVRDKFVRDYELRQGQFFVKGSGVLLEEDFARSIGVKVDDRIKILTKRGPKMASVVGLLGRTGASSVSQGGTVFLPLKAAQGLFKVTGRLDVIHLVLAEGADENIVTAAVAQRLPVDLVVRRPASRTQLAEETLYSSQEALTLATALSLMVSVFIILNTFLMNVGERRRQFSILRAIGATRRQVTRLLLGEGLAMGVIGTLLGMAAGVVGAYGLTRSMERVLNVALPSIDVTWTPFALGALFGIGVSLAGTLVPAVRAGQVSPLEGMSPVSPADKEGVRHSLTWIGVGLLALTLPTLVAFFRGWVSFKLSTIPAVLAMVGLVFLIPAALGPLTRFVSRVFLSWMDVEGDLAQRQVLRRRTRSWLTIGVLFVAIGTGIGMASAVIDNIHDVEIWYERTLAGDFFVRAMMPDMSTGSGGDMPEELGAEVAAIGGIENLDTVRFVKTQAAGRQVIVIARQFTAEDRLNLDLEDGDAEEVRQRLFQGEVVLSTVLAQRAGLRMGQEIEMDTVEGPRKLRIAGTTNEYSVGGLALYMQRDAAKKLLGIEGVDAFIVKAESAKLASVETALRALCDKHGLLLQSFADITRLIDGMIAGVVGCLWVILALGFVVAAFGIVNTLTMNVLEQTRELGLLRIVAMTRGQVRKMILGQAAIMGIVGLAPGTLAGLAVALVLNAATLPATGHPVVFVVHPLLMVGSFAVAMAIVLAVAWMPAERAARLELIEALHYE